MFVSSANQICVLLYIQRMKGSKYSILRKIFYELLFIVLTVKLRIAEAGLGAFAEDRDDLFTDRT